MSWASRAWRWCSISAAFLRSAPWTQCASSPARSRPRSRCYAAGMALYRYSRWDGTQAVEPFTASDVMDYLADHILDDGDLRSAMRDLLQRGANFQSGGRMFGLKDLLERLKQRRQDQLGRYNLGSMFDDIKQRLSDIVQTEREGIDKRVNDARAQGQPGAGTQRSEDGGDQSLFDMLEKVSQRKLDQLDRLPPEVG